MVIKFKDFVFVSEWRLNALDENLRNRLRWWCIDNHRLKSNRKIDLIFHEKKSFEHVF